MKIRTTSRWLLLWALVLPWIAHAQDYSRTEVIAYHNDLDQWVIGQVATVTCTTSLPASTSCDGDVVSKTDYDTNAMPWKTYAFGKLQQTLIYDTASAVTTGQRGTLKTVTDGRNNVITLTSWKRGIPQQIQHPATPDHPVVYQKAGVNDRGEIDWVTDENGYKTCYTYDAMGRLASITYPDEVNVGQCDIDQSHWKKTTISFHGGYPAARGMPAGHWRQYIETGGARKVTVFDALWRPVVEQTYDNTSAPTSVDKTLSEVAKRYDSSGRLAFQSYPVRPLDSFTNPNLKGIKYTYDALDRPLTVVQDSELGPLTTQTQYVAPHRTIVTNPRGKVTDTLYLAYDQPHYDWPRQIVHPADADTAHVNVYIGRDPLGKPLSIKRTSATGSPAIVRSYAYNIHHELCRTVEPETGTTSMGYDGAGNLAWSAAGLPAVSATTPCAIGTESDVVARKVNRTYDARNQPKELAFPDRRGDQTWEYTPDGLAQRIITDNGDGDVVTNQYVYDKRRLMTRETLIWGIVNWPISYGYNANGHLALQGWHGLLIDYAPNALGQPTQAGPYATGVSYHPNGAMAQFTYGNGIIHQMAQNVRGLPDRSLDIYQHTHYLDDGYDYDQNGNVAAISDGRDASHRGNRTMTYDGLDRLKTTVSPMFGTATYAYDVLDNLTRVTVGGTAARDHYYCYDAAWRLSNIKTGSCGGTTVVGLGYDLQGNLANKNGILYGFDFGNRLRSSSVQTSRYVYDGHGRRVLDETAAGKKHSHYTHAGQLAMTGDSRANTVSEYVYLNGSLLAIRERDVPTGVHTTRYQHTDALGSPVAVTDQNRVVMEKNEYEPFGKVINHALKDGPGYTGHVADAATGLNYMQQRYYDPQIGRFLSVDPVNADGNTGANLNRYWYANNNPYKFTDPDGRQVANTADPVKFYQQNSDSGTFEMLLSGTDPYYTPPPGSGEIQSAFTPIEVAVASSLARGLGAIAGGSAAVRWGPATGAGPLGEATASTFRGGSYTQLVTQETTTLFRAFGGKAGPMSSYWSRTAPSGPLQARIDNALLPKWGNTAEKVSVLNVPKGTTIFEGAVAPQGNLVGGGNQVFVPKPLPEWLLKK